MPATHSRPRGIDDNDLMIDMDEVSVVSGDVTLLPAVSSHVGRGETLVIRGRNGSGKSTLLRVLAGIRKPSRGSVRIGGSSIRGRDRRFRRRVAAMIGLPPMARDLTVSDHVHLVRATWTDDARSAATYADDILDEVGLDLLRRRFPHELSSGQRQLFGLALVLARPFEVLLVDEPEQRLDPEHLETVIDALGARHDAGATIVASTHSAELSDAVADRLLQLDSGTQAGSGTTA